MPDQVKLEELEAMSIWQLRDYARKMGHHSPTSQRKADLVQFIYEKSGKMAEGKEIPAEPPVQKKRGRPPKTIVTEYVNIPSTTFAPPPQPLPEAEKALEVPKETPLQVEESLVSQGDKPEQGGEQKQKISIWRSQDFMKKGGAKFGDKSGVDGKKVDKLKVLHEMSAGFSGGVKRIAEDENAEVKKDTGEAQPIAEETGVREGILELCPDGYGFLRAHNCEQTEADAYISAPKIKKSGLRKGDYVVANVKKIAENRPWSVQDVLSVNGMKPESAFNRLQFENLTPIFPNERYKLEIPLEKNDFAIRAIDLVAPIGNGQRAMLVSPPKAGKTTLLKKIAHSISVNNPKSHLIVLLIDERPEEVTDMQRSIDGEVIYSTFDELPEHHTKAAEMVLERAKRLVELGKDVVILLDSLTRLTRAYNLTIAPTGKTLSGGIDPGALYNPKRFFGAARNIENGGSLTIIATALVDTGSRMDDVIYEEFKGTGNMEIHLDRRLSEKRIFPAIDLNRSGTRKEELLLNKKELDGIWAVRKMLSAGDVQEATENLINMMMKSLTNKEFIEQLSIQIAKLEKGGFLIRN